MKPTSFILTCIFFFINTLAAQDQKHSDQQQPEMGIFRNDGSNYPATGWNPVIGMTRMDIHIKSDLSSTLENFICDAMLERTETDFSFINSGDITSGLFSGDITLLDLYTVCPLNRTLVVLEVDGAFLMTLVEACISGYRSGLAVGGGKFEYSPERPSGNRLTFFQIGNYPAYPKKDYRVVTTDYLADGHAGFKLLTGVDSTKIFRTNIPLRNAIKQYIENHTPLGPGNVQTEQRCLRKP